MIRDYKIIEKIGKGTFGIVYKVKRINDPLIYVIKQICLNGLTDTQINQVKTEAKLLSLIRSNYVVKYYDSFLENQDLNIVMEYCDNGDLCKYLSKQKAPLKEDLIWQIFIKITLGLTTIHKMKILHRDLKTLNIFLKKDMEIKIGDLGVAKELNQASFASTLIGTPYYLSPEMCEDKPYNQKSDVWALGCILYELCTYRHPFNASNHGALILKILNSDPDPILAIYSSKLQNLVNKILEKNFEKRPNCLDILKTPVVIEKAKKFGLYQEIINVFSNNNPLENFPNGINQKRYINSNTNLNYIPPDSEDILIKSQFIAPNYIDNRVLVTKLNNEEQKVLNNHNNKRGCISQDKYEKKINTNQNYYINNFNLNGYNKIQNIVQYDNINANINNNNNLLNNNLYNNNYIRNIEYNNINLNNNIDLINGNYYLTADNYSNLYNNNNNNIILEPIIANSNTFDSIQLASIINPNNEPVKCAKVTKININEPTHSELNNQNIINSQTEETDNTDIKGSISSLNVSVKPVPIDMDRINDNIIEDSTNSLEIKKENGDSFYRYPLNSDMPMDNCNEEVPLDNFRNLNKNTSFKIVSNENIEVKSTAYNQNNIPSNKEMDLNKVEIKYKSNINKIRKSPSKDNSVINKQIRDKNLLYTKNGIKILKPNNNIEIFQKNNNHNNIMEKKINSPYRKKSINDNNKKNKILNNQKKKFNLANLLFKKKTNEKILKTYPIADETDSENKLNKTSINLSSSDNFNIDVYYQEPNPIEMNVKPFNLNNKDTDDSNFISLKNNDKIHNITDEIRKDEKKIPDIDENEQENQIRIKEEIKSLENKFKKVQNQINLLIGEKDYKNIMELYSKAKNKDNLYVEIEKYSDNNKYNKIKKEQFLKLYLSLASIDSKMKEKKEKI